MLHSTAFIVNSNFTPTHSFAVIATRDDTVPAAGATLIPLSEYLNTTYRPDCDYINGEVKERTLVTRAPGFLQKILAAIFYANMAAWNIFIGPEIGTQVSASATHIRNQRPHLRCLRSA